MSNISYDIYTATDNGSFAQFAHQALLENRRLGSRRHYHSRATTAPASYLFRHASESTPVSIHCRIEGDLLSFAVSSISKNASYSFFWSQKLTCAPLQKKPQHRSKSKELLIHQEDGVKVRFGCICFVALLTKNVNLVSSL